MTLVNLKTIIVTNSLDYYSEREFYLFEYMSSWDKFDETRLPPKEVFHSDLNIVILVILVNMIMNMHKKFGKNSS